MKPRIQKLFLTIALLVAAAPAFPSAHADTLYVSVAAYNKIEKFDAATGADLGKFADANSPYGLAFDKHFARRLLPFATTVILPVR